MSQRLAAAFSALDVPTGGGEVLAEAAHVSLIIATISPRPRSCSRGVVVVADLDEPPLPFSDGNQQDLYRGGGHWIYGSHDNMPNHQMYRTDYNPDGSRRVDLIFNHEFQDPTCLYNLICGSQQYQYVR